MNKQIKEVLIGVVAAVIATVSGLVLYIELVSNMSYERAFEMISRMGLYGEMLTLAALPNLFVFFVFLKKNQEQRAKGILLATMVIAFTTLVLKFLK
tara:strand:+ start:324 stop:614 length:291 start_codon:yes stop_codon:yes gene_type:complete